METNGSGTVASVGKAMETSLGHVQAMEKLHDEYRIIMENVM